MQRIETTTHWGACRRLMWLQIVCVTALLTCVVETAAGAGGSCYPEPEPKPFDSRESSHSMVWFYLQDDAELTRRLLQTVKDMGIGKTQALVYWWKQQTMGGDYWKEMGYRAKDVGEHARRALDYYVTISHQLGMKPCLRLGTFRCFKGLYHPMDKSGSVHNYANWLRSLAARYRGKIDHYVIGDEENRSFPEWGWSGTPSNYMKVFIPLAEAIKQGDPSARVSPTSVSSAPATDWILELIDLGLPKYADGVAAHFHYKVIEDLTPIIEMMRKVREVWPEARFYANGCGYVENRGIHDDYQAGVVAQCMFTLWDIGWDSAPYYFYGFSKTADTHQNYGLMRLPTKTEPGIVSDAWKAYQTIAQTFYDRKELKPPDFEISLRQATVLSLADGTTIRLAPPDPVFKTYIRADKQLLIYLAYRKFREPREGRWDILLRTSEWGCPQRIPLLDYTSRKDLRYHREGQYLVVEDVQVGLQPMIITLRKLKK